MYYVEINFINIGIFIPHKNNIFTFLNVIFFDSIAFSDKSCQSMADDAVADLFADRDSKTVSV